MRVAIMQPTYLPWLGYFAMMDQVDCFVFLDSVQFSRRSWQQRNRIKSSTGEQILTVPAVTKGRRDQLIREVELSDSLFGRKHQMAVTTCYARAEYFNEFAPRLLRLLTAPYDRLVDLNVGLIEHLKKDLGIHCETVHSSSLTSIGTKAELLAAICHELGAESYLSAPGSREYIQESDAFARYDIKVKYNNFEHPTYRQQFGEFLPYMSLVDLLLNEGHRSLEIIRQGIGQPSSE